MSVLPYMGNNDVRHREREGMGEARGKRGPEGEEHALFPAVVRTSPLASTELGGKSRWELLPSVRGCGEGAPGEDSPSLARSLRVAVGAPNRASTLWEQICRGEAREPDVSVLPVAGPALVGALSGPSAPKASSRHRGKEYCVRLADFLLSVWTGLTFAC